MNTDVFITCAVTGAGDTTDKSPHVPVTPEAIADAAIESARAGAAIPVAGVLDDLAGGADAIEVLNRYADDDRFDLRSRSQAEQAAARLAAQLDE